jgi:hypothetical protein
MMVTTPGFGRIAGQLAETGIAEVIVQGGGYLQSEFGASLTSFFRGIRTCGSGKSDGRSLSGLRTLRRDAGGEFHGPPRVD